MGINHFDLEDPRVLAHWVAIYVNDKLYGVVKDVMLPIYGDMRPVAVMVSKHEITMFRRRRKDINYKDININDIQGAVRINDYISTERINESFDCPLLAEELQGIWQGIRTGFFNREGYGMPIPEYHL